MKLRALALTVAAALLSVPASRAISPVPQHIDCGNTAFASSAATYRLKGAGQADPDAVALLYSRLPVRADGNVTVIIGERGDKAVKGVDRMIPDRKEGYYLSVTPDKVIIAGNDETGTYYGVRSFLRLAARPEVPAVTVTDWPAMASRGVIEGFYGNPWSYEDRISQFDFYGANKMNIYVYGPKDDPYHHSRWYEPYPADKAAQMARLIRHAAKNKVKFTWAMHPSNSIVNDEDRNAALAKLGQMYDLGVRSFAIFFDDISAKSVDAQIDYLNFLDENFVKKHSDIEPLTVCPTQYNRQWSGGDYLRKMGTLLNPDIRIMWTGNSVCDMIDAEDCRWFTDQTTRKPFIWLNYPVNDYGMHNLLMGPVTGNDPANTDLVEAFCSNPMQYAEASKVALYGIADYCWNPGAFDPEKSWERSMEALMPDHTEAFKVFCLNNVDVAPSVHNLHFDGETPDFAALVAKYPRLTPEAIEEYTRFFNRQITAANELLAVSGNPLLSEVREWIVALRLQGLTGLQVMDMAKASAAGDNEAFISAYKQYAALTEQAAANISRNFPGSIQSVRVNTGTLHVAPFLKNTAGDLVAAFKRSGAEYPADLFPAQVVENGTYYIKNNGRWLGNPQAGSRGGRPVFQSEIDDINPNRQEWHIKLDPTTGRYSIINSKDERYINELGNFGTNPYSPAWNTYHITRRGDRYAIQNGGDGGSDFWTITADYIERSGGDHDPYIFELIPLK